MFALCAAAYMGKKGNTAHQDALKIAHHNIHNAQRNTKTTDVLGHT